MKKLLVLLLAVSSLAFPELIFAQTPTSVQATPKITDEATNRSITEQINTLKDRIASRVAELNLVEKRGIIGTVTEVSDTQITVKDISGKTRIVDVDEITKFSSLAKKTNFGISDIAKDSQISILGIYNKETRRLLARFVDEVALPTYIIGSVKSVNEDDFSFTVISENQKDITVDVENITRTSVFTQEEDLVRAGFSRIEVSNRIAVIGYPDKKDKTRIIASRVILFPELKNSPKVSLPSVSPTEILTPTTTRRVTPSN